MPNVTSDIFSFLEAKILGGPLAGSVDRPSIARHVSPPCTRNKEIF